MSPQSVTRLVHSVLDVYRYELPEPGTTYGTPFPLEHVEAQVELLKTCLVTPRLQKFQVKETFAEVSSPRERTMWVVAEREAHGNRYLVWYDAERECFGPAQEWRDSPLPVSFLTGDLVCMFLAI